MIHGVGIVGPGNIFVTDWFIKSEKEIISNAIINGVGYLMVLAKAFREKMEEDYTDEDDSPFHCLDFGYILKTKTK